MKYVKIFLASSVVEFEKERRELGDYIRSLNDIYVKRGIYFELNLCEDLSNAIDKERKQEQYNRIIRDSQYFYILFGNHAGEYTIEEFDVAWEQFRSSGEPKLYTYFMQLPDGQPAEKTVQDFMSRLDKEIGHYYSMFSHLDSVKLNMLIELTRDPTLHSTVKFEGGQATLDGEPVLSLENVPLYSKNETIQRLVAEMGRLEEEYDQIDADCYRNPEDSSLKQHRSQVSQQIDYLSKQLRQLEDDLLSVYETVTEKLSNKHIAYWEKEALHLVDEGDYEGAKAILRDHKREEELQTALRMAERGKDGIWQYISGKRTLIATLKATGLNQESIQEIAGIYEEITKLAEEYRIELEVLCEYASFLWKQRQYRKGIAVAERLNLYYQLDQETSQDAWGKLLNLLGILYFENSDFQKSEKAYRKALDIHRRLAKKDPAAFEPDLAASCNNLALLLNDLNQKEEAEQLYQEALEIRRRLAQKNPAAFEPDLADSCNNLAVLLKKLNQNEGAEPLYRESLEIHRRLAQKNPAAFEPDLAASCNNLSNLLSKLNQNIEAEQLYREAVDICRRLAQKNPDAFEPVLVASCNNLANLLSKLNQKEEAEQLYREALEIRRRLAQKNPNAFEPDLADGCNNLAILLSKLNQKKDAEQLYREALEIRRRLAQKKPAAFEPALADSCNNLAVLLSDLNQNEEAEQLHREALEIRRRLAQKNPDAFEPDLATSCNNLANLLNDLNQSEDAEQLYREALDIRRRLVQKNPDTFEPDLADSCFNFAILQFDVKYNKEAAKTLFQEALSIYEKYPHLAAKAQQVRDILVKYFEV